jgi:hypothetical protein
LCSDEGRMKFLEGLKELAARKARENDSKL